MALIINKAKLTWLLQWVPSLALFLLIWAALKLIGTALIDPKAVFEHVENSVWIKFLNPYIKNALLTHGWQPITALTIATAFYMPCYKLGGRLVKKFLPDLSDDAKTVLQKLYNKSWWPEGKLANLTGISANSLSSSLNELELKQLVNKRDGTKPRNKGKIIWQISVQGEAYLKKLLSSD